jgi:hypothetical protein
MKIRTIVGILLVFALVLGSTGIAVADGNEGTGENNGHGVGDGSGPLNDPYDPDDGYGDCDGDGPWWEES